MRSTTIVALLLLTFTACAGAQIPVRRRAQITARDYLPLRVGAAWSYDTATGYGGDTVLSAISVVRADGTQFYVRSGTRTERYERRADGVWREGEYIVRDPLRVGAVWEGRDGGRFEIRAVGETRTVAQRQFRDVIEVRRTGSNTQIETTTWYALDVGVIEVRARTVSSLGQAISVRSTLRGYTLGDSS